MVRPRIVSVGLILSIFLLVTLGRLVDLQLIKWEKLAAAAVAQHSRTLPLEEYARGDILDREYRNLTGTVTTYAVVTIPTLIDDVMKTSRLLCGPLGLSEAETLERLTGGGNGYEASRVVCSGLTQARAETIERLQLEGVVVLPVRSRYGPSPLAVHLLGHVGKIDPDRWQQLTQAGKTVETQPWDDRAYCLGDIIGVKGIEGIYEEYLRGGSPGKVMLVDALGRIIPGLQFREQTGAGSPRQDVILTIDREIQQVVEDVMDRLVARGAVVVLDVETRDILALASRPSFDPNNVSSYLGEGADSNFRNRAFDPYHPGSIFKVLVAAAALDTGATDLDESFVCNGSYQVNENLSISCLQAHGELTLLDAVAQSCNSTFIELALRLGVEQILDYARKMGLDRQEAIGYPLPDLGTIAITDVSPAKIANAALGEEGVRISPVQAASLLATVADGGLFAPPRVVKEVRDREGKIIRSFPLPAKKRVISPAAVEKLQTALAAVTRWGTGQEGWVREWGAGGKTGSAQTGEVDAAGEQRTDAWFVGYTPLESPKLAIAVLVEGGKAGGRAAAPVFREIAELCLVRGLAPQP